MSSIGDPINTSLIQAAQAQQSASKARDREKAETPGGRRFQDLVELRVAGLETADAVRKLPQNESQESESEHEAQRGPRPMPPNEDEQGSRIDVTA
jgi:hypothetical protein